MGEMRPARSSLFVAVACSRIGCPFGNALEAPALVDFPPSSAVLGSRQSVLLRQWDSLLRWASRTPEIYGYFLNYRNCRAFKNLKELKGLEGIHRVFITHLILNNNSLIQWQIRTSCLMLLFW